MLVVSSLLTSVITGFVAWWAGLPPSVAGLAGSLVLSGLLVGAWSRERARHARLDRDAEETRLERTRSRLRWLGLAELWGGLDRDPQAPHFDERILRFVQGESGFSRCALLHLNPQSGEVAGRWQVSGEEDSRLEPVRWSLAAMSGAIADCLQQARPQHSRAEVGRGLIRVGGELPAGLPRARFHLVLPLLGHLAPTTCLSPEWLHRPDCERHQSAAASAARLGGSEGFRRCASCRHYPLLGALVFQTDDEERDLPRETKRLDPLATMVSSLLEHRRLHQRSLAEGRLREGMLDAMWNGLVGTDAQGRILFSNRRARELANTEDWLGHDLIDYLELPSPDALTRALLEQVPYSHADAALLRRPDPADAARERVPVRIALNPVRPDHGARAGLLAVFEDRRRLQALESEVRHLDTLAAMGRFASALAHEIRNPLGGIQAGISYLRRAASAAVDEEETLEVMEGEIQRVDTILRSLLSVARPQEIEARDCDLRAVAEKVKRSLQPLLEQRHLNLSIGGEGPQVLADEGMMHQVLLNLIKNAVEASPERGLIRVFVEEAAPSDPAREARGLQVRVEDSGPGLDPEVLARLFEPFASRKVGGTGLGLYVCHNFVERHGGRLSAENLAAGGARFTVRLPCTPVLIGG